MVMVAKPGTPAVLPDGVIKARNAPLHSRKVAMRERLPVSPVLYSPASKRVSRSENPASGTASPPRRSSRAAPP